jgi:hypothetical protein
MKSLCESEEEIIESSGRRLCWEAGSEEVNMARNDVIKKVAGKAANASNPEKSVKTEASGAKASPKTQKKPAAQKKLVHVRAKPETTFRLVAPQAAQVFVAGCFNEWDPTANRLEQDKEGTWSCTLAIEPGEHEYRFVVDGVWWDDPTNISRRWNEFGTQNCVLIVQG